MDNKVTEFTGGDWSAERILEHTLRQVRNREITQVVIICVNEKEEGETDEYWVRWNGSPLKSELMFWATWLHNWLVRRYFGGGSDVD